MAKKTKPSIDKVVGAAMRKVLEPRPVRRARVKSEADLWYEQMLSDFKKNGASHLASARSKMKK